LQGVRSRRRDGDLERETIGYLSVAGTKRLDWLIVSAVADSGKSGCSLRESTLVTMT
jgi:hypothetical protein